MTGQKVSMSSKDSVKAYERLFSEMLGMDDKDAEKEMWHNMAMIGFAIAAGESPSALQNIANGMLAGTKMMKEDRATRQKREDAVKTMAIERAFKLEDDATKFTRDLQLANIRATKSGIGTQEPFVDAVRVLAQKGLDAGLYKTMEEALAAADAALRPYYTSGASGGLTEQLTGGTDEEMVEVIQDGKKIKVKKSQLPNQG